jgi:hypothetical protein
MKRKITKIDSHPVISRRLIGYGTFRITGPCKETKQRVTVMFKGLREEAEQYELHYSKNGTEYITPAYSEFRTLHAIDK